VNVLDASVVTDALVVSGPDGEAARAALGHEDVVHAPYVMEAEVVSAFRGMVRRGDIDAATARTAISQLGRMRIARYSLAPFLDRVWALRDNVTVYDAWYVAVAEALETRLITQDLRLVNAAGVRCPVERPAPVP
jgi:predicted nucleic acid-binding protein